MAPKGVGPIEPSSQPIEPGKPGKSEPKKPGDPEAAEVAKDKLKKTDTPKPQPLTERTVSKNKIPDREKAEKQAEGIIYLGQRKPSPRSDSGISDTTDTESESGSISDDEDGPGFGFSLGLSLSIGGEEEFEVDIPALEDPELQQSAKDFQSAVNKVGSGTGRPYNFNTPVGIKFMEMIAKGKLFDIVESRMLRNLEGTKGTGAKLVDLTKENQTIPKGLQDAISHDSWEVSGEGQSKPFMLKKGGKYEAVAKQLTPEPLSSVFAGFVNKFANADEGGLGNDLPEDLDIDSPEFDQEITNRLTAFAEEELDSSLSMMGGLNFADMQLTEALVPTIFPELSEIIAESSVVNMPLAGESSPRLFVLHKFIPNSEALDKAGQKKLEEAAQTNPQLVQDIQSIGIMDVLSCNLDRNIGNLRIQLTDKGEPSRVFAIDNSIMFTGEGNVAGSWASFEGITAKPLTEQSKELIRTLIKNRSDGSREIYARLKESDFRGAKSDVLKVQEGYMETTCLALKNVLKLKGATLADIVKACNVGGPIAA